ncbi:translation initiation factor eIF 4e-like domain-containing protein [Paraphysoderma sedebokerense]|nr:translation initiation factor eIF 4e-like domain-containing protein [Paraphysoderma sedebokerense]
MQLHRTNSNDAVSSMGPNRSNRPAAPSSNTKPFSAALKSANDSAIVNNNKDRESKASQRSAMNVVLPNAPVEKIERHPLRFSWVCWFMYRKQGEKIDKYEENIKKVASFSSIEDFWAVYSHLARPHQLPSISDYHLFKQGVRPVWEDDANINGGKWIVRLKKGLASRYWEDLILAVIGDQFSDDICGIVLSIRNSEDILSLWNQDASQGTLNLRIRDTMKRILSLPADTVMEYKAHNDALRDNSSFRNTDVFK